MAVCDFFFQACFAIVTLPLLSFALIMIFTWRKPKLSLAISLICSTIPLILAWTLFFKLQGASPWPSPSSASSTGWCRTWS